MAILSKIILEEVCNQMECIQLISALDNAIQAYHTCDCLQPRFQEPILKINAFNTILRAIDEIIEKKDLFEKDIELILALKLYRDKLLSDIDDFQKNKILGKIEDKIAKYKVVN